MSSEAINGAAAPNQNFDMFRAFTGPPAWMTRKYIEDVMKDVEKDPALKLQDYRIVSATKPGDNFASIALRLKATYTSRAKESTKSFIIKIETYEEGFRKEVLKHRPIFESEISMYSKTLPEMQRLLQEIYPAEVLAPPVAYSALKPNKIIFIGDISPEFAMSEEMLNYEQALEVLSKIGKYHAASVFLGEEHEPMSTYREGFISENTDGMMGFFLGNMSICANAIAGWGPEMELVSKKLLEAIPTMSEKLKRVFNKNETEGYNVLTHGDFHIKNIMFRNQKDFPNSLDGSRLIDFQLPTWSSPASDLCFCLYGMVGHEARERREELIGHYHKTFKTTLEKLGYLKPIPTLLDVQMEILRNGALEVFVITSFMPMFYADRSKMTEQGEMALDAMAEMTRQVYDQPEVKAILMKLLPTFLYKGFLDA